MASEDVDSLDRIESPRYGQLPRSVDTEERVDSRAVRRLPSRYCLWH